MNLANVAFTARDSAGALVPNLAQARINVFDLDAFLKTVLGPQDRASLLCFGNHLRLVADRTSSAGAVLFGLRSFEKGSRYFPELGPGEMRMSGTAFYDSIYYMIKDRLEKSDSGSAR